MYLMGFLFFFFFPPKNSSCDVHVTTWWQDWIQTKARDDHSDIGAHMHKHKSLKGFFFFFNLFIYLFYFILFFFFTVEHVARISHLGIQNIDFQEKQLFFNNFFNNLPNLDGQI